MSPVVAGRDLVERLEVLAGQPVPPMGFSADNWKAPSSRTAGSQGFMTSGTDGRRRAPLLDAPLLPDDATVGQRIRAFREWRRMSRAQLAGRVHRSESWLYQIERGIESRDQRLSWALLRDLADCLGVEAEDLLGEAAAKPSARVDTSEKMVLAVLPIRCASASSARLDEALSNGLCDDLVTRLTKLTPLIVIGPDSTRPLLDSGRTLIGVGHALNAKVVLIGSLRELPVERFHLNLRIVEVATSVTRWSEVFDGPYSELETIQTQVVASIANGLRLRSHATQDGQPVATPQRAVNAFELYLRGVGLLSTNHERDVAVGLAMLERAIEFDEAFADAHAYRGYALWRRYFSGWDADVTILQRALTSADRALALDASCVLGRLARIRIYWDLGRHEAALAEGLTVYRENPDNHDAILALARAYNNAGMAELALPLTERVLAFDAANRVAKKLVVWNHLMVRDYSQATAVGDAYLRVNPDDANTAWAVATAHVHLGELELARAISEQGLRADRHDFTLWLLLGHIHRLRSDTAAMNAAWQAGAQLVAARLGTVGANYRVLAWLACLYAGAGARDEAIAAIARVREAEPGNGYLLYRVAHAYAELEERDEALAALEAAVQEGFLSIQMWRAEEVGALSRLVDHASYARVVAALESRVMALKKTYAPPTGS
jgi:adenylate cyclase